MSEERGKEKGGEKHTWGFLEMIWSGNRLCGVTVVECLRFCVYKDAKK